MRSLDMYKASGWSCANGGYTSRQPHLFYRVGDVDAIIQELTAPIPMRLTCPECGELHVDEGEFATKPHHTHACQSCGMVWRPAVVNTVGVRFLPGYKNP